MSGDDTAVLFALLAMLDVLILAFVGGWGLRLEHRLERIEAMLDLAGVPVDSEEKETPK